MASKKYTAEHVEWLSANCATKANNRLTAEFNAKFGLNVTEAALATFKNRHRLMDGKPRVIKIKKYTGEHIVFLRQNAKGRTIAALRALFNAKFGLNVTELAIQNLKTKYGLRSGINNGQFKKGHATHNKGKKWSEFMSAEGQANSKKTQFKHGHLTHRHRPVGSERVVDGYHEIKAAEPNVWRQKHVVIYESVHGPIPKGSLVIFLDGNTDNLRLENLALIDRAVHARLNQCHMRFDNTEATKSAIIVAEVMTKIGRIKSGKQPKGE